MKFRTCLFAFLTICVAAPLLAQPAVPQNNPLISRAFTLDVNRQIGPQQPTAYIDLRGLGVYRHSFIWYEQGTVSAGACALQGGLDIVTFGTTIIAAQTVTSTATAPTTVTDSNQNFVRINCTTPITGSGTVYVVYYGWGPSSSTPGAATIADGSDVAQGTTTDPANCNVDATAATLVGIGKCTNYLLSTPVGPATAANSNPFIQSYNTLANSGKVALTTTASISVIGGTASNYIYVTACTVSNASLTVSTDIILQDGSGGTTLWNIPNPAAAVATTGGGGAHITFPIPLKVPTAGNALYAANVTSNTSQISCNGFKSTVSY